MDKEISKIYGWDSTDLERECVQMIYKNLKKIPYVKCHVYEITIDGEHKDGDVFGIYDASKKVDGFSVIHEFISDEGSIKSINLYSAGEEISPTNDVAVLLGSMTKEK